MQMRKILRKAAKWCGVSTTYHVAAIYRQDSHVGTSQLSTTCRILPWLHADNYHELMTFVEQQAIRPQEMPGITSITKLGI